MNTVIKQSWVAMCTCWINEEKEEDMSLLRLLLFFSLFFFLSVYVVYHFDKIMCSSDDLLVVSHAFLIKQVHVVSVMFLPVSISLYIVLISTPYDLICLCYCILWGSHLLHTFLCLYLILSPLQFMKFSTFSNNTKVQRLLVFLYLQFKVYLTTSYSKIDCM